VLLLFNHSLVAIRLILLILIVRLKVRPKHIYGVTSSRGDQRIELRVESNFLHVDLTLVKEHQLWWHLNILVCHGL